MSLVIDRLAGDGCGPYSLSVENGGCAVISGASGAGKSRFLRLIADLDPSTGHISLDGRDRSDVRAPDWRRLVAYIPAEPAWWTPLIPPHFTDRASLPARLGRLGLEAGVLDRPVAQLSTGERQRLALLRALDRAPRALLLDEPTAALDPESTGLVESLVAAERRNGLSVVWVTHDAQQAERVATNRFVLDTAGLSPFAAR